MGQTGLAELGEVLEDDSFPGFVARQILLAAIFKVDRTRLIDAIEKHERVGPVGVKPYQSWRERNRLFGGLQCDGEIPGQHHSISNSTYLAYAVLEIALPLRVA